MSYHYTQRLTETQHDIHIPDTHPGLQTPESPRRHFITITFTDPEDTDTSSNRDTEASRPRVTGLLSDSVDLAVFLFHNRRPTVHIHDATDHGPYEDVDGDRVLATCRDAVNAINSQAAKAPISRQETLTDY